VVTRLKTEGISFGKISAVLPLRKRFPSSIIGSLRWELSSRGFWESAIITVV
jgi:hypothetical protein